VGKVPSVLREVMGGPTIPELTQNLLWPAHKAPLSPGNIPFVPESVVFPSEPHHTSTPPHTPNVVPLGMRFETSTENQTEDDSKIVGIHLNVCGFKVSPEVVINLQ